MNESKERVSYTGYSRFGLLNIFRALGFGHGTKVLVPAYICDVALLPFKALGIEPVYYGITEDFQIRFDTIQVTAGVKGILTVSYFGFSIDFNSVEKFARDSGLVWINDNAHGHASWHGDRRLASFGDFSVTSFRKIIPSLNGARIAVNSPSYAGIADKLAAMNTDAPAELSPRYAFATVLKNVGFGGRPTPDYSDIHGFAEEDPKAYRASKSAIRLLGISDEKSIGTRRRALYRAIEDFLERNRYDSLSPIPGVMKEGNSPLVFPVRVRVPECWKALLRAARSLSMDIHTWPSMPLDVIERNIFGCVDMWSSYLYLPLHQDLDAGYYCSVLKSVLDSSKS